jgi:hypothetical protein
MKQNRIEKWAQGKDKVLVTAAKQFVVSSEDYYQLASALKEQQIFDGSIEAPPLSDWLTLYGDQKRFTEAIRDFMRGYGGYIESGLKLCEVVDQAEAKLNESDSVLHGNGSGLDEDEKKAIADRMRDGIDTWAEEQAKYIEAATQGNAFAQSDEDEPVKPEILFLMIVVFPCWVFHQETPVSLLEKARQNDLESLEKLLRIDPSIIFDKRISELVHGLRFKKKGFEYDEILKALRRQIKAKISRQRIKAMIAGYISYLFKKNNEPITEPEIRALFDAVAYEMSGGEQAIDSDLPESPEAFSQTILRERKMWIAVYPDRK